MRHLKSLPKPPDSTVKRFGARYPWAKWFKAGTFTLVHGRDFLIEPHGMRGMVYNRAGARGLKVRVEMRGGTITVIVKGKA